MYIYINSIKISYCSVQLINLIKSLLHLLLGHLSFAKVNTNFLFVLLIVFKLPRGSWLSFINRSLSFIVFRRTGFSLCQRDTYSLSYHLMDNQSCYLVALIRWKGSYVSARLSTWHVGTWYIPRLMLNHSICSINHLIRGCVINACG